MPNTAPYICGSADQYIGIIKLKDDPAPLIFGPFTSYIDADIFIRQKALEYTQAKTAYVDPLYPAKLYPGRSI